MEIPIRQAHTNHVLVPVTVQGVGTQFVLDTAAGMTFITPETRAKLGHGRGDDGESREVAGAGGSVAAETTIVRSLVVGPHERKDLQVVVLDFKALQERVGEDFGGILGMDFLKDFDVRLDLRAKSLRLHPHDAPAVADEDGLRSLVKIPFRTFGSGFIFFDAEVGGRPVTGVMDVGAGHSIVNWRAAHAAGVTRETAGVERETRERRGADNKSIEMHLYKFGGAEVGGVRYAAREMRIADLPVFKQLGLDDRPALIFGADLLENRVLFISYSTGHFYLSA